MTDPSRFLPPLLPLSVIEITCLREALEHGGVCKEIGSEIRKIGNDYRDYHP